MRKLIFILLLLFIGAFALAADNSLNWVRGPVEEKQAAYGEMFHHNDSGTAVAFPAVGTYENITFFEEGEILNINFTNNTYFVIIINGTYELNWQMSFTGGGNHEYQAAIFINDVEVNECDAHRKMGPSGDVGSMSGLCLLNLSLGDMVNLRMRDNTNPVMSIGVQAVSVIMMLQEGVGKRNVLENRTIVNNNMTNNLFEKRIWFNYSDPVANETFLFINESRADHISVQHINIEGQYYHDIGQGVIASPALWNETMKRVSGLDEVYAVTFYQARGVSNQEVADLRSKNDTNLSDVSLQNHSLIAVPSMQWSDLTSQSVHNKHSQEQIFYDNEQLVEPTFAGLFAVDTFETYPYKFTYVRDYNNKPEFQCTCEVSQGIETELWRADGGFINCDAQAVTNTTGDAYCTIFFNSQSVQPTRPYYVHVSTRWWEYQPAISDPLDSEIYIEWNANEQAQGG